jgi:hypothetical protein
MELQLEKPWDQVMARLMEHNPDLTQEDLYYEKGKEEALLERLSKKMGRPAQAIKEWIESMSFNE